MSSRKVSCVPHVELLVGLVCLIGSASSPARADELRPPWQAGPCTLWTRVPPELAYLAPLETDEGIWAASYEGVLMRRQADWTMSMSPEDLLGSFTALVEGAGWTAATTHYQVFVRTHGQWNDTAWPSGELVYASGGGRNLFVATRGGGVVFQYDVDAGVWQELPPALTGRSRGLWGDLSGLYLRYDYGSSIEMTRFDGASWTHIPSPAFQGYSDVAGLSADEVYAIAESRLYRVDGGSAIEVPAIDCGGTPIYQSLSAAPGQLVVELSCLGQHQLWKREIDDWTFVATLPGILPQNGALRVSSNGQVYIGGGRGALFRVLPDGLESLEQSPGPPASALGGTSASSLFAGGDEGVAQLVDGDWQLLAGSPPSVRNLWQAPSGALFAAALDASGNALWKYDGSSWSRLLDDPTFGRAPYVYGRSESDYYYWIYRTVLHWDGATWTQLPQIPCEGQSSNVGKLALAGSDIVLAHCIRLPSGFQNLFEFTGTSWVDLGGGYRNLAIFQAGPVESPVTYLLDNGVYRSRSQSGWAPFSLPAGYGALNFTSADGSLFVASNYYSYATTDGTQPWSVVYEWVTGPRTRVLSGLWTDGRFAGSTRAFGGDASSTNSIVVCDLGLGG